MRTEKLKLGEEGEEFAAKYLKKHGWRIAERNFKEKWGELDIIAMDPEGILVFIEVKTMKGYTQKVLGRKIK